MKTIEIKGTLRPEVGKKSSKQIRKSGLVPCVIYGKEKNIHFQAHENSFISLIYTPDAHLVNLELGSSNYRVVLKDVQFHPVTDKMLHADFIEVSDEKPIVINLPILVTGDSVGVKAGGKLRLKKRSLKVKGFANDIPEHLEIDVTNLKIHQSIKVGDLSFNKIELLDPKITTVATVATSRVVQKGEGEEGAGIAGEGGEASSAAPAE